MEDQKPLVPAQKLLDSAESVVIILPGDPSPDLVSAGLSLHLSLKSIGKNSQIGCGTEVHVAKEILGSQEILDSIGSRNLIISFDYHEDDLEKVDYDTHSDGKFYLLVKPKAGSPVPDISHVKYSYSGANADLVIVLGINSLEELGKIYADEKSFLDTAKILSLNISARPASFTPNLFHYPASSYSELVTRLLEKTEIKPSSDAAQNLLSSVYTETKSLTSPQMTADTFSAIAYLMRHGASLPTELRPLSARLSQPAFFEAPASLSAEEDGIPIPPEENQPVPKDWTKPKIFRASDL
jgi:hypothetical protein